MVTTAKWVIIFFGLFIICVGFLMLLNPAKAKRILQKAGSTNFINYAEITIRMIPAIALIIAAPISRFPEILKIFGWFMLATSVVLYFVPRRIHHSYSLKWAERLKPSYIRWIAPFAFALGGAIIYSIYEWRGHSVA